MKRTRSRISDYFTLASKPPREPKRVQIISMVQIMGVLEYILNAIMLTSSLPGEILTMSYINITSTGEHVLPCRANGTYQSINWSSNNYIFDRNDHYIPEAENKIEIINHNLTYLKIYINESVKSPLVVTCLTDGGNIGGIWIIHVSAKETPNFETELYDVLSMSIQHCSLQDNGLVLSCPGSDVYWTTPPGVNTSGENSIVVSKAGTYACSHEGTGKKILEFNITKDGNTNSLFCEQQIAKTGKPSQSITDKYTSTGSEVLMDKVVVFTAVIAVMQFC